MKFGLYPTLTKSYILDRVSQEQIFETYFGVTVVPNQSIPSPIRSDDADPSFTYYYNNQGRLRGRDFRGDFWGDCWDAVGYVRGIDSSSKKGFKMILEDVAATFKLHAYTNGKPVVIKKITTTPKPKASKIIHVQPRNWNPYDKHFWGDRWINKETLDYFEVSPCKYVWINYHLVYTYTHEDPAYVYNFHDGKITIYYPNRKKYRFIMNHHLIQGINKIKKAPIGVITKSYKDIMSLHRFGINAIAPPSETASRKLHLPPISENDIAFTRRYWGKVFSLMDYDNTGIHMAWVLRKLYDIEPLFLTSGQWKRKQGYRGAKDFSEYLHSFGWDETNKLIKDIYATTGIKQKLS